MPTSFAFLCTRIGATDDYERLKKIGLLNTDLQPMPYGEMIAIPITEGELKLEFQPVEITFTVSEPEYFSLIAV